MPQILQIAQLGNPFIRKRAKLVQKTDANQIQKLIDDMIITVKEVDGVGLAASQVYQSLRLCIIASRPNYRYPKAPEMKPLSMINPKIVDHSQKKIKDWEGCLSIPGIRGLVPRFQWVIVEYLDRHGKERKRKFKDFVARIVQHELDHLNGEVYIDRMTTSMDLVTEVEYRKLVTPDRQS